MKKIAKNLKEGDWAMFDGHQPSQVKDVRILVTVEDVHGDVYTYEMKDKIEVGSKW